MVVCANCKIIVIGKVQSGLLVVFFIYLGFWKQGLTKYLRLALNFLYSTGWPQVHDHPD
jgi:hypothetical protein